MLRRSHKKSRNGCRECKRRHIKCDESRPRCGNCTVTERVCKFETTSDASSKQAEGSKEGSPSEPNRPPRFYIPVSDNAPINLTTPQPPVNFEHMELLIHYSLAITVPGMENSLCSNGTRTALMEGLKTPCLMLENLSISARSLAVIKPERSQHYMDLATLLQTQAIEEFNSSQVQVDRSNCVALLLFSTTLGRHLLIDTLAHRTSDFQVFLDSWVRHISVHVGLRAVASAAWPLLLKSEIEDIISWGAGISSQPTKGHELENLAKFISGSHDLGQNSVDACLEAIRYLQIGLDAFSDPNLYSTRYQMVFNWCIMCPAGFIRLLEDRRPEALIIMGHYSVILHLNRDVWQVGDSGKHLFCIILQYLRDEWKGQLLWPQSVILGESQEGT